MAFWFKKKVKPAEFRQVSLPGDVGTLDLPSVLTVELENNSTLLAYLEGSEDIELRISSVSCVTANDEFVAKSHIRDKAAQHGYEFSEIGENGIATHDGTHTSENGAPLLIRFWEIGSKNTFIIITASILEDRQESPIVTKTLRQMPRILESLKITTSHRIIESAGREVEATVRAVDPPSQEITQFGQSEQAWLDENLQKAHDLSMKYGSGGLLDPAELDRIFSRWTHEHGEKEPPEVVANSLGAAFGKYLVEHHGFRWVVVTDEYGTENAVRHEIGETTAFPRSSVLRRIGDGDAEFFQDVYLMIVDRLQRAKSGG